MAQLTVVVPSFNEADNLHDFIAALRKVLAGCDIDCDILGIDDGSGDGSFALWQGAAELEHEVPVRAIRLSRNFGKEAAISCGLQHVTADAAIVIDADFQDPPELIPDMIQAWQAGHDSVLAIRRQRNEDGWLKRMTASAFYRLMGRISEVHMTPQAGDFRLLSRRVLTVLNAYPERQRFMKGLFASAGFSQTSIEYDRPARHAGKSHFSLWRLWNFALDGITSFSSLPLRVWSYCGFLVALAGFLYAGWIFIRTLIFGVDLPGYASLFVAIVFFAGVQLISIGVLGEYIARLFVETKRRPLYLVEDSTGFDEQEQPGILPPGQER